MMSVRLTNLAPTASQIGSDLALANVATYLRARRAARVDLWNAVDRSGARPRHVVSPLQPLHKSLVRLSHEVVPVASEHDSGHPLALAEMILNVLESCLVELVVRDVIVVAQLANSFDSCVEHLLVDL